MPPLLGIEKFWGEKIFEILVWKYKSIIEPARAVDDQTEIISVIFDILSKFTGIEIEPHRRSVRDVVTPTKPQPVSCDV